MLAARLPAVGTASSKAAVSKSTGSTAAAKHCRKSGLLVKACKTPPAPTAAAPAAALAVWLAVPFVTDYKQLSGNCQLMLRTKALLLPKSRQCRRSRRTCSKHTGNSGSMQKKQCVSCMLSQQQHCWIDNTVTLLGKQTRGSITDKPEAA